jgi:hypothetical protein
MCIRLLLAAPRVEAQLLGMLKIPLFAAPTVKFPELRFLVVQTCQHVVQTCAPAEMLGGLLKSQEINVTDTVLVNLSLLTTGNLYDPHPGRTTHIGVVICLQIVNRLTMQCTSVETVRLYDTQPYSGPHVHVGPCTLI